MNEANIEIEKIPRISALGYICQLYIEGKLANISDEEALSLYDALIAFDQQLERPWDIDELEYKMSENFTFREMVEGVIGAFIKGVGYVEWRFQYTTLDLEQSTSVKDLLKQGKTPPQWFKSGDLPLITKDLWYIDELKLTYAKRKIFAFMRERPNLNAELHNTVQECVHVSDFFARELSYLCAKYPETYTSTDHRFYTDAHTPEEILEKLQDTKWRFIRYLQDDSGRIVAYFESRQDPRRPDTQVIQWFFTDESIRWTKVIRRFWNEFIKWCQERWIASVWSYAAKRNYISIKVHEALMSNPIVTDSDPNELVFDQKVDKIQIKV